MSDGCGLAAWQPPWRQSFWKNVRTKRTMRTKPVGRWVIGIIVSNAWPAYRVCEGIETLSAEGNAATVARHGDGMGEGDGHGYLDPD
jgi:hypothetical protein